MNKFLKNFYFVKNKKIYARIYIYNMLSSVELKFEK